MSRLTDLRWEAICHGNIKFEHFFAVVGFKGQSSFVLMVDDVIPIGSRPNM